MATAAKAKATKAKGKAKAKAPAKVKAKAKGNGRAAPFADEAKITAKGEHNRREGSDYFKSYELMKKGGTVADFKKKGGLTGALRAAVNEGFAKVG